MQQRKQQGNWKKVFENERSQLRTQLQRINSVDESPRRAYHNQLKQLNASISSLLLHLNSSTLHALKTQFQQFPARGMAVYEFILSIRTHLSGSLSVQELPSFESLVSLFATIDVNSDKTMEWEEVMGYLVNLATLSSEQTLRQEVEEAKKKWKQGPELDLTEHLQPISQFYFISSLNLLTLVERGSWSMKLYTSQCDFIQELSSHRSSILSVCWLETVQLLAASAADQSIHFYHRIDSTFHLHKTWTTTSKITSMADAQLKHIFLSDEQGNCEIWNLERQKLKHRWNAHLQQITSTINLPFHQFATSSLDGTVKIWDNFGSCLFTLLGHAGSVDHLYYNSNLRLLVSTGIDRYGCVWHVGTGEKVCTLQLDLVATVGRGPTIGVAGVGKEDAVMIGEARGIFTVFSLPDGARLYYFGEAKPEHPFTNFALSPKGVLYYGHQQLSTYHRRNHSVVAVASAAEQIVFSGLMHTQLLFLTLLSNSLTCHHALTGELCYTADNFSSSAATTACFDSRQRRLFVGNASGQLLSVDAFNGAALGQHQAHNQEVTSVCMLNHQQLISSSVDGTIAITNDKLTAVQRKIKDHNGEVVTLITSNKWKQIATAGVDKTGNISLWQ